MHGKVGGTPAGVAATEALPCRELKEAQSAPGYRASRSVGNEKAGISICLVLRELLATHVGPEPRHFHRFIEN